MEEKWTLYPDGPFYATGFKVASSKKKRVPDDEVYAAHPELQQLVPRGLVLVQVDGKRFVTIFANRKFFGRKCGDDDDDGFVTSSAINGDSFQDFLESEKANGENCQISCIHHKGKTHWIIGSKNRKIIAGNREHIQPFKAEMCYSYACEMAETFFDYLDKMGEEKAAHLTDFFRFFKLTLNFEFESPEHPHIVPLYSKKLVLIGATGIHFALGWSSHPIIGYSIAKYFGFPSVLKTLETFPRSHLDNICGQITRRWEVEGSVLILLDSNANVVDFVKVKAWWYVILRAIREKVRFLDKSNPTIRTVERIHARLAAIKNSMGVSDDIIKPFLILSKLFLEWILDPTAPQESAQRLSLCKTNYPRCWLSFLTSKKLPLDSSLIQVITQSSTFSSSSSETSSAVCDQTEIPLLVLMQGIPGIGKTSLAKEAEKSLNSKGTECLQISQDDFAHLGQKNSGQACFDFVEKILLEKNHRIMILARNNSNRQQYDKYLKLDFEGICRLAMVAPLELTDKKLLPIVTFMCICSTIHRKYSQEGHPIDENDEATLSNIVLSFLGELKISPSALKVRYLNDFTSSSVLNDKERSIVQSILNSTRFQKCFADASSKGFSFKNRMTMDDIQKLGLNDPQVLAIGMKLHRPLQDKANDMVTALEAAVKSAVPPFQSFMAVTWDHLTINQIKNQIQQVYRAADICPPSGWNQSSSHTTLMHSNNFFEDIERWQKLSGMIGTEVLVQPEYMVHQRGKLTALSVKLVSVDNPDTLLDALVLSNVPHVTIEHANSVKAMESADAILHSNPAHRIFLAKEIIRPFRGVINLVEPN